MTKAHPRLEAAARALSLSLALAVFGATGLTPFLFGAAMNGRIHGAISLLLLGASAGAVHGFGFEPEGRIARILASPLFAWPVMATGTLLLAR